MVGACVSVCTGCDLGAALASLAKGLPVMLSCELVWACPAGGGSAGVLGTEGSLGAKEVLFARGDDEPHGDDPCSVSLSAEVPE